MHVICFDQPYPPIYGGAIDVYYKLKALHEAGIRLIVHIFMYNGSTRRKEVEELAEKTFYYNRDTGIRANLSLLPYIVRSRNDKSLLENLTIDDDAILFEGIHTTFFLNDKRLAGRRKIVRMHNIEHKYYFALAKSNIFSKKMPFYLLESIRLRLYEHRLRHASCILPISHADCDELHNRYPECDVRLLQCFYDSNISKPFAKTERYILYHGNLAHTENIRAAKFILENVEKIIPVGWKMVIAGRNPSEAIKKIAEGYDNVEIIDSPDKEKMDSLVKHAHINLLITFQETGVKLKLLNTLTKSFGYCVVNTSMLYGTPLQPLCFVADSVAEIADTISTLSKLPATELKYLDRQQRLSSLGFNDISPLIY